MLREFIEVRHDGGIEKAWLRKHITKNPDSEDDTRIPAMEFRDFTEIVAKVVLAVPGKAIAHTLPKEFRSPDTFDEPVCMVAPRS